MIDTAENSYSEAYLRKYRKLYPLLGGVGRPKSYERFLANARAILAFDGRDELGAIACPTLILGGEEDKSVDALLGLLCERLYGEDYSDSDLRAVGHAVEERVLARNETDAETAAEELFALYLKTRSQTEEDWRAEYRATAAELVRTELMLDAVAEEEKLSVDASELERRAAELGEPYGLSAEEVLEMTGEENLRFQLLRAKARSLIEESAEP